MAAVTRSPEAVAPRDRLVVLQCDVLDAPALAAAMQGADAVICTVGPSNNRKPGTLISEAVRNLLTGCLACDVGRFVFESGMMAGDGHELSTTGRLAVRMAGALYPALKADKIIAEAAIVASPVGWTIVRPPTLNHAAATHHYIAAPAARINPAKSIGHADCAAALLTAVTEPSWTRQVINVGRR